MMARPTHMHSCLVGKLVEVHRCWGVGSQMLVLALWVPVPVLPCELYRLLSVSGLHFLILRR